MKEKKRVNFIDITIVLCVVLIILAVVFRAQITEYISKGTNLTSYSVEFESEPLGNGYVSYISAGDPVEWVEKDMEIGTVGSISETVPSAVYTVGSDGKLIITESDTTSTVRGVLSVRALENDGCFISGTEFIGAGMKMTLRAGNVVFDVTVLSVTKN